MTIYLIRHGKTAANEMHLYCGSTDLPLSETGKAELQELHFHIENARFITSGMKRTNETLSVLFGDVPHEEDSRFREVDFGIFEMHCYAELKDTPEYQKWLTGDNEANVPPNGESGNQMRRRVLYALSEIQEDTAVITHGGVIAAIMEHLFPDENKNRYEWQPKNGCGYVISGNTYKPIPLGDHMIPMTDKQKKAWAIRQLQCRAQELCRPPFKADFDEATRARIKNILGPWPRALEAAGLKEPKSSNP